MNYITFINMGFMLRCNIIYTYRILQGMNGFGPFKEASFVIQIIFNIVNCLVDSVLT